MGWFFKKERGSDFDEKIKSLDTNVRDSFENLKRDMKKVSDWITNFSTRDNTHDTRIGVLEHKLERLNDMVEHLNTVQSVERPETSLNNDIDQNNEVFTRVQSFNRSVQSFMNVHEHADVGILTPAQKQVIALLTYAGGPLSYGDISRGLQINEVTARRHINDIRRAGFSLKRKVSVNNRRSMFYLDKEVRDGLAKDSEPVKLPKNKPK